MPESIAVTSIDVQVPPTAPGVQLESAPVPITLITRLAFFIALTGVALIYLLLKLWPGKIPPGDFSTISLGWGSGIRFSLWIETRYILIVAVAGAIGSYIHVATSFCDFVGNRTLKASWELWYILRPLIGAFLAIVVYFVIRGGLMSSTSGADQMSPYGLAASSCLCGLFSKQASDKLQEIFEDAFRTRTPVERSDPMNPQMQTIEVRSARVPSP